MRDIICERRIFNCKTHCEDAEILLFTDGIFTLDLKAPENLVFLELNIFMKKPQSKL